MNQKALVPATSIPAYEIKDIDLREYFLVVLKRRRILLSILLVSVTLAAIYTFFETPVYVSFTRINIEPATSVIPAIIPKEASQTSIFLTTQAQLLKGKTIAKRVQQKLNLTAGDLVPADEKVEAMEFWNKLKTTEDKQNYVAEQLMQMIEVTPIRETTLFMVVFSTPDAQLSKTLAQTWADEYIEYSLASMYEYSQKAGILLGEQIKNVQSEIARKQKILQDYSAQKQVILLGIPGKSIMASKLEDLNRELSIATGHRIAKEVVYRDIENHGKYALPEVRNNPIITRLQEEYAKLEHEYAQKSSLFLPNYPIMQSLRQQMDQIKQAIETQANDVFGKVLQNAKADYQQASNREGALKAQVSMVKGDTIYASQEEFNYEQMKLELAEKQKNLEALLAKQTEVESSTQAQEMKAITIRIVDEAMLPKRPDKPDLVYNLGISIAIGLIVGFCAVFITDYLDRSFKNVDDVQRHLQLPFLGIIPKYQVAANGNGKGAVLMRQHPVPGSPQNTDLLTAYNPESIESEAFRSLRAALLVSFPENPPKTIMVTSGQAGEGKTFIASNLAITLTQLEKKVVIVDADMRNPRLHLVWKLANDTGLSRFLTSDVSAASVTRSSQFNGLSVITAGARTPRPTELLSSNRFDHLLSELQQEFDHIIIDTPPVIPVSDSLVLASKCNCVVLVVRAGVTPREIVNMAREKLIQFDATLAGAILNGTEAYFYHNYYSSYSGYGNQQDTKRNRILKFLDSV